VNRYQVGGADRTRTGDGGFADLCLTTWLRRQERQSITRFSGLSILAGQNALRIEKAENLLASETIKSGNGKLGKPGLEAEALKQIRQELYGLSG
jgi:hypothetical protein